MQIKTTSIQVPIVSTQFDFHKKIKDPSFALVGDVIVSFKYSDILKDKDTQHFVENIHAIIDNNEKGQFTWGPFALDIKQKRNLMDSYKRVQSIDLLLNEQQFNFV